MKRFLVGLTVAVMCTTSVMPVSAAKKEILSESDLFFYGQNGIYFYKPKKHTCFGTLMGSDLREKVLSGIMSLGYNEIVAAGIYSNFLIEGIGPSGPGYPLVHEFGVSSLGLAGVLSYQFGVDDDNNPLMRTVSANDVTDLYNPGIQHGLGFAQWSYGLRVKLLEKLEEYGLEQYATDFNGINYTYQLDYDDFIEAAGEDVVDGLILAQIDFIGDHLNNEVEGYNFGVQQDDISWHGWNQKYGIEPGMTLGKAFELISTGERNTPVWEEDTPERRARDVAILWFSTVEMSAYHGGDGNPHVEGAPGALKLIEEAGLEADVATIGTCGGNHSIVDTAMELAWEGFDQHSPDDPKPEYDQAMREVGNWWESGPCGTTKDGKKICVPNGASCDVFVSTVMMYSGVDPDFPRVFGGPGEGSDIMNHLRNTDRYERIDIDYDSNDHSILQPGDIFVTYNEGNHIFIFLGEFDGRFMKAEASFGGRTGEYFYDNIDFVTHYNGKEQIYEVYRKI